MRLVSAFTLIILLLVNLFGFYAGFVIERHAIRESQDEYTESGRSANSSTFTFTQSEYGLINWIRQGKEFLYEGCYYDVEKVETDKKGDAVLYVDYDGKETNLVNKAVSFFKDEMASDPFHKSLKFWLPYMQDFVGTPTLDATPPLCIEALKFVSVTSLFRSFANELCSPPPWFFNL